MEDVPTVKAEPGRKDYDLGGFNVSGIRVEIEKNPYTDTVTVWVFCRVQCVETNEKVEVTSYKSAAGPFWNTMNTDGRHAMVMDTIMQFLRHEVEEQLRFRGKAVYDPHRPDGPPLDIRFKEFVLQQERMERSGK